MTPVPDEESAVLAEALKAAFPESGRAQVRVVNADDPSPRLLSALENIFPNLEFLCLDPTHLPMTFEYGSSRRRTAASRVLRSMMRKFTAPPRTPAVPFWSPFKGFAATPLTLAEANKRNLILSGRMSRAAAGRILEKLSADVPWQSRYEYIEAMAALASLHAQEMTRKIPGPNKTGSQLLYNACSPVRFGWFANNMQARCKLPARFHAMLPSGTTSNEALHSEVKAWFRQTQAMHRSTLQLKLQILLLGKSLPHYLALRRPTLRQVDSGVLLARAAACSIWSAKTWQMFAATCQKAILPLSRKRTQEALQAKREALKRPASIKRRPGSSSMRRRTPFNKPRKSSLRLMGKKTETT